jgi:hypothetical protein
MKMDDWKNDKKWSDKFLPEIKSILGVHLIAEPPSEEDAERNTDLMVLKLEPIRIGCRIRKHEYAKKYGNEFTIRSGRPKGTKTELMKIIEGWGDYFFYGFATENEESLSAWFIGDMKVFRSWFVSSIARLPAGEYPGASNSNKDMSSDFLAFPIHDLPSGFVVARKLYE